MNTKTKLTTGMNVVYVDDENIRHRATIVEINGDSAQLAFADGDEGSEKIAQLEPVRCYDLTPAELEGHHPLYDLATADGHASLSSFLNDGRLWDETVEDVTRKLSAQ